jgi:hypothetical protein
MGGRRPTIWGSDLNDEKMNKYTMAFDGHQLMIFNAATNQNSGICNRWADGSMGGWCTGKEVQGEPDTIVSGGGEVKGRKKLKIIELDGCQWTSGVDDHSLDRPDP